ncbi:MAG: hypothetical protein J7K35_02205 [Syntrophobacterales bacterium]|nr:hypothetical protein [Syntrophobacterales bacterium]
MEHNINELEKQIRKARKTTALAQLLRDKLTAQKIIKVLGKTRNRKRRELFDVQDAINAQWEGLIENIEKRLQQKWSVWKIFTIRWKMG